jgi:hypothetical protein
MDVLLSEFNYLLVLVQNNALFNKKLQPNFINFLKTEFSVQEIDMMFLYISAAIDLYVQYIKIKVNGFYRL